MHNISRRQEFVIVFIMAVVIAVGCFGFLKLYMRYGGEIAPMPPITPTSTEHTTPTDAGCATSIFVIAGYNGEDHTVLYCIGRDQCFSEKGWEAYTIHRFDMRVSYSTIQCTDDVFTISIAMSDGSVHVTDDLFEAWRVVPPDEAIHQPPWGHFWYSRTEHCTRCPEDCTSEVVSATCMGAQYAVVRGTLVEYTTRTDVGLVATQLDDLVYLGFGRKANEHDLYGGE